MGEVTTSRKTEEGWGDQRDSNPQQPESQSGTLPLSYGHQPTGSLDFPRLPVKFSLTDRPVVATALAAAKRDPATSRPERRQPDRGCIYPRPDSWESAHPANREQCPCRSASLLRLSD